MRLEQQEEVNSLKLLKEYLEKDLIEHGYSVKESGIRVKELLLNHKNLFGYHGLAWELGKHNLEFFCMFFLNELYCGDDKSSLSKTHKDIWVELQNMILKKDYNNRNYIFPRGFGKTTCISTPLAIWCHCYKYKRFTVIASAIGDTAEAFLKTIKNAVDGNKRIEKSFDKMIDSKRFICNTEKIEFTNGTMIQSISASSTLRGKNYNTIRIELLICDDYQSNEQVKTEEQRDKKWKTFNEDAKNAMQKSNSTMLAVGTVQHESCFYNRLKASPTWKTRHEKGVLIDNVDEYLHSGLWEEFYKLLSDTKNDNRLDYAKEFYFQHESEMQFPLLWEEYWNCLDYALSYYEDRVAFMQEVQGDLSQVGEKRFKTIVTKSEEYIENQNFIKTCLSIDPAGTQRKGKKKDYYAFALGSVTDNNLIFIRKGEVLDFEYEDYIEHTLFLLHKYKSISHVSIEKNVYSGADVIKLKELISRDKDLSSRDIEFINEHRTKNKLDRINTIVGACNLGQIIFNQEDTEAIEQLHDYCGEFSVFDDFPDVVSDVVQRLSEIEVHRGSIHVVDKTQIGWNC